MFGVLAIMGDVGCSLGPWITGVVSDAVQNSRKLIQFGATYGLNPDQITLKFGILIAIVFPILILIGVLLFKENTPVQSEAWASQENLAEAALADPSKKRYLHPTGILSAKRSPHFGKLMHNYEVVALLRMKRLFGSADGIFTP